jgi:hypothetical protein
MAGFAPAVPDEEGVWLREQAAQATIQNPYFGLTAPATIMVESANTKGYIPTENVPGLQRMMQVRAVQRNEGQLDYFGVEPEALLKAHDLSFMESKKFRAEKKVAKISASLLDQKQDLLTSILRTSSAINELHGIHGEAETAKFNKYQGQLKALYDVVRQMDEDDKDLLIRAKQSFESTLKPIIEGEVNAVATRAAAAGAGMGDAGAGGAGGGAGVGGAAPPMPPRGADAQPPVTGPSGGAASNSPEFHYRFKNKNIPPGVNAEALHNLVAELKERQQQKTKQKTTESPTNVFLKGEHMPLSLRRDISGDDTLPLDGSPAGPAGPAGKDKGKAKEEQPLDLIDFEEDTDDTVDGHGVRRERNGHVIDLESLNVNATAKKMDGNIRAIAAGIAHYYIENEELPSNYEALLTSVIYYLLLLSPGFCARLREHTDLDYYSYYDLLRDMRTHTNALVNQGGETYAPLLSGIDQLQQLEERTTQNARPPPPERPTKKPKGPTGSGHLPPALTQGDLERIRVSEIIRHYSRVLTTNAQRPNASNRSVLSLTFFQDNIAVIQDIVRDLVINHRPIRELHITTGAEQNSPLDMQLILIDFLESYIQPDGVPIESETPNQIRRLSQKYVIALKKYETRQKGKRKRDDASDDHYGQPGSASGRGISISGGAPSGQLHGHVRFTHQAAVEAVRALQARAARTRFAGAFRRFFALPQAAEKLAIVFTVADELDYLNTSSFPIAPAQFEERISTLYEKLRDDTASYSTFIPPVFGQLGFRPRQIVQMALDILTNISRFTTEQASGRPGQEGQLITTAEVDDPDELFEPVDEDAFSDEDIARVPRDPTSILHDQTLAENADADQRDFPYAFGRGSTKAIKIKGGKSGLSNTSQLGTALAGIMNGNTAPELFSEVITRIKLAKKKKEIPADVAKKLMAFVKRKKPR